MQAHYMHDVWDTPSATDASMLADDSSCNVQPIKVVSAKNVTIEGTDNGDVVRDILNEIRYIRAEHSKRCTVYLVVAATLFAMLFLYIDRLHTQVHRLSQSLRLDGAA